MEWQQRRASVLDTVRLSPGSGRRKEKYKERLDEQEEIKPGM
jgi:hypothetical protein